VLAVLWRRWLTDVWVGDAPLYSHKTAHFKPSTLSWKPFFSDFFYPYFTRIIIYY